MHLSTVKIPVDFELDNHSASVSFLTVRLIFFTHLQCLCITIAGYRSNRSLLLIMLTERKFCRKSSINIVIDNRYCNRFIHLGRPIFAVNPNGACLCLQSRPHLGSRMRVSALQVIHHHWKSFLFLYDDELHVGHTKFYHSFQPISPGRHILGQNSQLGLTGGQPLISKLWNRVWHHRHFGNWIS